MPVESSQIPVFVMPIQTARFACPRLMEIVLTVSRLVSIIRAMRIMRGNVATPGITGPILHYTPDQNTLYWIPEYLGNEGGFPEGVARARRADRKEHYEGFWFSVRLIMAIYSRVTLSWRNGEAGYEQGAPGIHCIVYPGDCVLRCQGHDCVISHFPFFKIRSPVE